LPDREGLPPLPARTFTRAANIGDTKAPEAIGVTRELHKQGLTHTEYLTIVYRLGFTPCSQELGVYLGKSVRQLQRYYQRQSAIPHSVQILISLYDAVLSQNPKPKPKKVVAKVTLVPRNPNWTRDRTTKKLTTL
jgi:hypothetical protein